MRFSSIALAALVAAWFALSGAAAAEEGVLPADGHPEVVTVGGGSYASRPPRDQNKRPWLRDKAGWGDDSQVFSGMRLYVSPENLSGPKKRPIPSTDWWTSLVTKRWSGELWAYPGVVKATPAGVEVGFPRLWTVPKDGRTAFMNPAAKLTVGAVGLAPLHAEATDWGDWSVVGRLPDASGRRLDFTIAHGMPFTFCEFSPGLKAAASCPDGVAFGQDAAAGRLGIAAKAEGVPGGECAFGLYFTPGSQVAVAGGKATVTFPEGKKPYLAVAVLPSRQELEKFAPYAPLVPRATKLSWEYSPAAGKVATKWEIEVEDLDGKGRKDVLQGWLPHHYQAPAKCAFKTDGARYPCPRGELRLATGHSFTVDFPFAGLLPAYPNPEKVPGAPAFRDAVPYDPAVEKELIEAHRERKGFGTETYWGGKLVLHFGQYMELARQAGMQEACALFRDRAAEAVSDWLTFTPGEGMHFFCWYPRWGSFVGCRSRDNANPGVDILQDHHMCYGYHLYCAALLFFQDKAFAKKYGPMARLVAKDYAEWDPQSKLFCRFRNLDPWCGHSWSGGLGGDRGNGQESSSEAMQGYGAMFLLGEALGDKEMRDAGAFAWATEARGIAEYYFDRGHRNFPKEWPHTMSTNIHTEGLGFWTWFSGNPFWMHAIQWLPMSPLLCYLGEDPEYAAADFQQMWKTHEGGKGWDGYLGKDSGPVSIALNYLALSDPVEAAKVFAKLWQGGSKGLKAAEAGHMYWRLHALQRLGRHRFDAWTDVATSQAFGEGDDPAKFAWVAFNAADQEKTVHCFYKGKQVAEFKAAPGRLTVMRGGKAVVDAGPMAPVPEPAKKEKKDGLIVEPEVALLHQLDTQKFTAYRLRGGKKEKAANVTWSVRKGKTVGGKISADGTFTPETGNNFDEPKTEIVAASGGDTASAWAVVEEARRVGKLTLAPQNREPMKIGVGDKLDFTVDAEDQFKAWIETAPEVTVEGGKALRLEKVPGGARVVGAAVGKGALVATLGGKSARQDIEVVPDNEVDVAPGAVATASGSVGANDASRAIDRDPKTRWESPSADPQWLCLDFGADTKLAKVVISWEAAHAKEYRLETSADGKDWKTIHSEKQCRGKVETIALPKGTHGRYLRMYGVTRSTGYGYSLWSLEAYRP